MKIMKYELLFQMRKNVRYLVVFLVVLKQMNLFLMKIVKILNRA